MIRSHRSSIIRLSGLYCHVERLRTSSQQARRCDSSCAATMCDTTFRFPAGLTTFAKRHPSTPRCPASAPPKASLAWHSLAQARAAASRPKPPCRRTSTSNNKSSAKTFVLILLPLHSFDMIRPHANLLLAPTIMRCSEISTEQKA